MRKQPVLLVIACLLGCGETPQVREYVVPREEERLVTTEALRSSYSVMPFQWKVPAEWRSVENDEFSKKAWTAGSGQPAAQAKITITDLPASAGLKPQIDRWSGQVKLDPKAAEEALQAMEQLPLGDADGSWVELKGEQETILGMIIPVNDVLWIVKYRSVNPTAEKLRSSFRGFCESLKVENAGKG